MNGKRASFLLHRRFLTRFVIWFSAGYCSLQTMLKIIANKEMRAKTSEQRKSQNHSASTLCRTWSRDLSTLALFWVPEMKRAGKISRLPSLRSVASEYKMCRHFKSYKCLRGFVWENVAGWQDLPSNTNRLSAICDIYTALKFYSPILQTSNLSTYFSCSFWYSLGGKCSCSETNKYAKYLCVK